LRKNAGQSPDLISTSPSDQVQVDVAVVVRYEIEALRSDGVWNLIYSLRHLKKPILDFK
jgi:hypothetical protein